MLRLATLALLLALAGRSFAQPAWSDPNSAARKLMAIQAFGDHFTIGQSVGNLSWYNDTFVNNGAKWDFHVMYMSGGPAYPGAPSPYDRLPWWQYYSDYPTVIMNQLRNNLAKPMYPWFTFYAMAQGWPGLYGDGTHISGGPAAATPMNAHDPVYMKAYFDLFKILMQKVGAFPTVPAVIHVEPDEWGHILLNGTYTWPNLDVNTTFVYVGGSGHPELVGFPDNIYGWARAFKKLRDTYAGKNALLICNPSAWDSQGTMSGSKFGAIMKYLAGDWEGAVLETGDRDKGSAVAPGVPPFKDANGVPTISITGNFDNHVQWITDFHNVSKLPMFVWQAASGNTIYKSCNQVDKHYMDNLMETLLGGYPADKTWVTKYVNAGCYGWMFNPGQGFSTHVDDDAKDGITNPTAFAGNQGLTAIYADDDGGYTRLRGKAYYDSPYSLLGIWPGTAAPTTTTAAVTTTQAVTSTTAATAANIAASSTASTASVSTAASSTTSVARVATTASSASSSNAATTTSATSTSSAAAQAATSTAAQSTSTASTTVATTSLASTSALTTSAFASGGVSATSSVATTTTESAVSAATTNAVSTNAVTSSAISSAAATNSAAVTSADTTTATVAAAAATTDAAATSTDAAASTTAASSTPTSTASSAGSSRGQKGAGMSNGAIVGIVIGVIVVVAVIVAVLVYFIVFRKPKDDFVVAY